MTRRTDTEVGNSTKKGGESVSQVTTRRDGDDS